MKKDNVHVRHVSATWHLLDAETLGTWLSTLWRSRALHAQRSF